ncbi:dethiobiotin synthase [Intrasporangium calvum]|uniref:ATP-dependent dethiobiotin synthetase BioD n=1 Tax=Intrasporangium calvum TaxID=53358 RepID=A0ABT5GFI6_9MICO|nr:dethiobiotin synthase [Intrasporangium calvum]MDC5696997.1 dethiobiotin synthase [Intrasporangium calvum]
MTGTDTEVGKTVVTAATAAVLAGAGLSPAAYKPVQTGVAPGEPGDMGEVERLSGIPTLEGCRLREPMAPRPAATLESATLPTLADHVDAINELATEHDPVIVEGAGGLLVELTDAGETLADLALALPDAAVIVVARSALGTLNHTMLTREALRSRGIRGLGTVIGSWPDTPSHLEQTNHDYLAERPEGVLGAIPQGAPTRDAADFRADAPNWLTGLAQRLGTP